MRWAVLLVMTGCGRTSPPGGVTPEREARPDSLAVGWYLKAAVSEYRGQTGAAERGHAWVDRLDPGPWPDVRRGEFLLRHGRHDDARVAFELALSARPQMPEARLGLGLANAASDPEGSAQLLEPLLAIAPCRIASAGPESLRERAEVACRAL